MNYPNMVVVVKHGDTILPDTVATNTKDCIVRFLSMEGMGKYLENGGWEKAESDGYTMVTRLLTEL